MLEVKVPSLAESITEVTLAQWLVEDGEYVEMDQALVEMETDKASQELYAEKAGTVKYVAAEGDDLEIGALICTIDTSAKAPEKKAEPKAEEKKAEAPKAEAKKESPKKETAAVSSKIENATPLAANIASANNVNAANIKGTGANGKITKADVVAAIENGSISASQGAEILINNHKAFSREETTQKMSRLRKTISRRLVEAKNSTAMLTTFNEVNLKPIMDIRAKYKKDFREKYDVNLGFMSFFTRACALALQKFPAINAYIDEEKGQLIFHDYVDVSIAVSTPKGLVVPVIRNAESLSMDGIEKEVKRLAVRGLKGELTIDEMDGGTFSITNGGVFGSMLSTPILNMPQSAILGMHNIIERPMAVNGEVVILPMMYLALSYDHRVVDGKESVSFLVAVKNYLENPETMLIGEDPVAFMLGM
ncbi:MAG: 2-oxoglutarate dehydrogenase complex dihydrolipoyllysine-residue succinyltransferase [Chitinophagales bacterium]